MSDDHGGGGHGHKDVAKTIDDAIIETLHRQMQHDEWVEELDDRHDRALEAYHNTLRDPKTGRIRHQVAYKDKKKREEAIRNLLVQYVTMHGAATGTDVRDAVKKLKKVDLTKLHTDENKDVNELVYHASNFTGADWFSSLNQKAEDKIAYTKQAHNEERKKPHVKKMSDEWKKNMNEPILKLYSLEGAAQHLYKQIDEKMPSMVNPEDFMAAIQAYQGTPRGRKVGKKASEKYHAMKEKQYGLSSGGDHH